MGEEKSVEKPKKKMDTSRGTWSSHMEFVLSCLGYAVGLGNLWRFPYVCYINGGGAFLIPYFVMLLCVGIPAFLLELSVGQYSSCGPMTVWSAVPLLKGVGLGMVTISSMLCVFYTMLLGYCLHYMFFSFYTDLPWASCRHAFNSPYCYSKIEAIDCERGDGTWFNQTCYNETYLQTFDVIDTRCNGDVCTTSTSNVRRAFLANVSRKLVMSSEEYLNRGLLEISDNFEETGGLKWQLCVLLFAAWTLCFLCLLKGIHSSGKVVFFTALLPYVILFILLLRGLTLPGAVDGILFFITPQWHKLTEPKIWGDAAGQVFFSLSVGGGGLMTFASYSKFHNNIYRDSIIITMTNSLTSIFAGFVVFSILGHMAFELGKPVADVVTEGATLAFVAYPQVMSRLPVPQLWSVMFFLMLLMLGLDSLFATVETVITALVDCMPRLRQYRVTVTLAVCVSFFLLGLPLCTRAGIYWLQLIAYYGTGWSLIVMGLVEVIAFPWIYGVDRLMDDISYMIGYRVGLFWWFTWKFLTPFFLIVVLIYNIVDFRPLTFGAYELPAWAQAFGLLMTLAPIAMIVVLAVYQMSTSYLHLTFTQRLMKLCEPSDEWAPNDEKHRLQEKEISVEMSNVTVLGTENMAVND